MNEALPGMAEFDFNNPVKQNDYHLIESITTSLKQVLEKIQQNKLPTNATWFGVGSLFMLAISKLWRAFAEGFLNKLSEWLDKLGNSLAEQVVNRLDVLRWRYSGLESKYCDAQASEFIRYRTEGLRRWDRILFEEIFIPLELSSDKGKADAHKMIAEKPENIDDDYKYYEIWDILSQMDRVPSRRSIAVLANVGFGKTSLLQHVAICYSKQLETLRKNNVKRRIPVLLNLREIKDFGEEVSLAEIIVNKHIPSLYGGTFLGATLLWAENFLLEGRGLILLDGFDEIHASAREKASYWVDIQIRKYHHSIFIITSRNEGFSSYKAEEPSVILFIKKFNKRQRDKFIENWYSYREFERTSGLILVHRHIRNHANKTASGLIHQIESNEELRVLAQNPLLLTMIAHLNEQHPGRVPKKRAELYQNILRLLLEDRPKEKGIQPYLIDWRNSQTILQWIAFLMSYKGMYQLPFDQSYIELINTCMNKLNSIGERDAHIFMEELTNVSQVMIKREEGSGHTHERYEFSHQSFQDFLAASQILRMEDGMNYLFMNLEDGFWKEIILFYSGLQHDRNKAILLLKELCNRGNRESINLANKCLYESPCLSETGLDLDENLEIVLTSLTTKLMVFEFEELEIYLKHKNWQKADESTYCIFIKSINKLEGDVILEDDFKQIPRAILLHIDELWNSYSQEKFGLRQQKNLYRKITRLDESTKSINMFARKIGWMKRNKWLSYDDINYDALSSSFDSLSEGYLPIATANAEGKSISSHVGWSNVIGRIKNISID